MTLAGAATVPLHIGMPQRVGMCSLSCASRSPDASLPTAGTCLHCQLRDLRAQGREYRGLVQAQLAPHSVCYLECLVQLGLVALVTPDIAVKVLRIGPPS
jgi:hypothetical protein